MVQSKWDICLSFFMTSLIISPSFRGQTVTDFLEWLTPSSLASLKSYTSTLSVLLNEDGGIIDDTIVTKHAPDAFYVVTNAGRRERDLSWFKEKLDEWNVTDKGKQGPVELEVLENWGLLALQGKSSLLFYQYFTKTPRFMLGPKAASYLQGLTSFDLRQLTFGSSAFVPIEGFNLHVARGGYTGEDGFEVNLCVTQQVLIFTLFISFRYLSLHLRRWRSLNSSQNPLCN
jgi:aminomethyltransferase